MAEDEGVCLAPGGYGGGWMVGFLLGGDILGEDLPVGGGVVGRVSWSEGYICAEEPYPEPSIFSSRFRIASGQVGCPTLSAGFIRRV